MIKNLEVRLEGPNKERSQLPQSLIVLVRPKFWIKKLKSQQVNPKV